MTTLSQVREEFIEASCPLGASQEQIQDMQMAFDAGCAVLLQQVLEISSKDEHEAEYEMKKLAEEVAQTTIFHAT